MGSWCLVAGVVGFLVGPAVGDCPARTWRITPDGTGDAPSIQAGIDSSVVGDTVLLSCGTYYEHDIEAKPGLFLVGETGEASCAIIDAEYLGRGIRSTATGGPTWIRGMTIRHGIASGATTPESSGGAIMWEAAPLLLAHCVLSENSAEYGGGLSVAGADSVWVVGCEIGENSATVAGGGCSFVNVPYCDLSAVFIQDNTAENGGGVYFLAAMETEVHVTEAVFLNNVASAGGGISSNGTSPFMPVHLGVEATTFFGNGADLGGSLRAFRSILSLQRSILAFGNAGPAVYCAVGGNVDLACCDIFGNAGGDWVGCIAGYNGVNGNISADPSFCSAGAGDLTLRSDSPCLPGQHPDGYDCGLIGALGEGCSAPAAVEHKSWGGVKALFR